MKTNLLKKIKKQLLGLPENFIILVAIEPKTSKFNLYKEINLELLDLFVDSRKDITTAYISINSPYDHISNLLKQRRINQENLFFIDCITKRLSGKYIETKKCRFVNSPENLTEIERVFNEVVKQMNSKNKFIFLDSLSTLQIYNEKETLLYFLHSIIGKMRVQKINGVLICLHQDNSKGLIDESAELYDKIIEVK